MVLPRLHLIGIFHTQHSAAYSHCAFTGKALRFPKMLMAQGFEVIEYSNAGSEAGASEHVLMLSAQEFQAFYGNRGATAFHGDDATIGSAGHHAFEERLIPALRARLQPQDIICHPFGHAHQRVVDEFPDHQHVETGIGYPTLLPNSFRIFESYAWMHYHQGRENRNGRNYEWVVPNYYDVADWDVVDTPGAYLAFLGRITELKGMDTLRAIADHSPWPIVLHGQGDASRWAHPNIHYRGPLTGRERSAFLGGARALLAPSVFTEPFCGMAVEAMLCGTPVVSVDYGAMTETVQDGMGFRCHTLQDWMDAICAVGDLDRAAIAERARARYSLEACGQRYATIFRQLNELYRKGWYELREISFQQIEHEEGPFAERLAGWLAQTLQPARALDIGCGPGTYVRALRAAGVEAVGVDSDSRVAEVAHVQQGDLLEYQEKAPLVLCLEVAEHIAESLADAVVAAVARSIEPGGVLIWSAAQPGQGGVGHINCQPKDYWADRLAAAGLQRDVVLEQTLLDFISQGYHMGWFRQNVMVYRRALL